MSRAMIDEWHCCSLHRIYPKTSTQLNGHFIRRQWLNCQRAVTSPSVQLSSALLPWFLLGFFFPFVNIHSSTVNRGSSLRVFTRG
ncbi:hypothetical protein BDN72DRAFT_530805 [Pluteus cervinus]|uniref:Uncharacterized protein n=1 Tax=Pluteus cervinus TaxID=181527 RepID=A0ACD3A3U3_9AGAR|nr:hypothetical protein BDN72DRAFT_530805 [Pluteus cervinus]